MFDDLPFVDRIWKLCLDIYLVREAMLFSLEEYLYAKLIFLYRSPETMIKWTRPKPEEESGSDSVSEYSLSVHSKESKKSDKEIEEERL